MGQANVTLFILSMILMLASITLLLILFFIPIFTKRFSNPFARIHINLLLVFLIFINLIELTLFIVDFYILTKQDLLPKMYYEVAGPLIHIIILVLLILSFLFVFVTYLERFAISFKISNSIEISIHLITIVLPVVIVIFNIICFGEMVYLEIFKTRKCQIICHYELVSVLSIYCNGSHFLPLISGKCLLLLEKSVPTRNF